MAIVIDCTTNRAGCFGTEWVVPEASVGWDRDSRAAEVGGV